MRKMFFVGLFLASLFCGTFAVLAKKDGAEECDAMALGKVLAQARGITASAAFLQETKPTCDDIKKVIEELVAEQGKDLARMGQGIAEMDKKEYEEALKRYWGRSSLPKLKND
ncbi:MAG: hypothetical protein UT90_C0016G0017 [Parcubacteria group bacterium GW2011_GWA1_40_21]|nr:MAG: hypothetical protein UT90_C0016G0017 [Parcubacteria group bacterium GW2011_GWA1_40_21]